MLYIFIHSSVDEHLGCLHILARASLVAQMEENLPSVQETQV